MSHRVIELMVPRSPRSLRIANVICQIVVIGAKLGELEHVEITDIDGRTRMIGKPPVEWMDRIATAAEVGAFDRLSDNQIVLHILSTPGPTQPEVSA